MIFIMKNSSQDGLYILQLSIHGLIRGKDLELGRDPDTGGQTKYVVELGAALGDHPAVDRVDLVTRRIIDKGVSADYGKSREAIHAAADIVRIEDGVDGYIAKEFLWDSLDNFTDNLIGYLREQSRLPDIIHSHYADAGYVGSRVANLLGIPQVHTGHSLGRVKRSRLLATGLTSAQIETRYNMARRINAEEETLGIARLIVTSTFQEIDEQYGLYDFYQPEKMRVIAPGTDLRRFTKATGDVQELSVYKRCAPFLRNPEKPVILALSRPDPRKNIGKLIEAYGLSPELQDLANLVIIAGNREDIREMDDNSQEVLEEILLDIDYYDLYGKVAYPKQHLADEVPLFYQMAALLHGVFVNPALTEPFGLTLIEAAACGLPVIATNDGGPIDILHNCRNGLLIDPLDVADIQEKLGQLLQDGSMWREMAKNGLAGVERHYSWPAHVEKYLSTLEPIIEKSAPPVQPVARRRDTMYHDRALFTDLDQTMLCSREGLEPFVETLYQHRNQFGYGIATGRRLDSALQMIKRQGLPYPDVLITSLGTEISYGRDLVKDGSWATHIDYLWKPRLIRRLITGMEGIKPQRQDQQSYFKISFYIDPKIAPTVEEITTLLHQHEVTANIIQSFGQFLDIVPIRAGKGYAMRWYAERAGIPVDRILAAGGSGADEDMMRGNTLAVVVANRHHEELSDLIDIDGIYFAENPCAAGMLEAIEYYDFFNSCQKPEKQD
jgi:sucrose-phosphate synthase